MKKISILFILLISSIAAFAQNYAYISHVERYNDRVEVTISASSGAFNNFPSGFRVGVRPANHIGAYFALAPSTLNRTDEKIVTLSPDNPSQTIIFYCGNKREAPACNRDDFVINFRS